MTKSVREQSCVRIIPEATKELVAQRPRNNKQIMQFAYRTNDEIGIVVRHYREIVDFAVFYGEDLPELEQ